MRNAKRITIKKEPTVSMENKAVPMGARIALLAAMAWKNNGKRWLSPEARKNVSHRSCPPPQPAPPVRRKTFEDGIVSDADLFVAARKFADSSRVRRP
ncbi:hypothetical protein Y032_0016g3001 [Ancylostoma ceylanicum]|uniref:Uncharacterized protein n=1 Tax=Ancylostoma ceylanicum TaxID=53326 RepID=A0A016V6H4_9BILA|nr:hypothetical protein Y032_0016g3001 [Ancylostoma ceylanicum]